MTKRKSFTTLIHSNDSGGAFVIIPFDVEAEYGKKRVKIKAWFDGEPYRGSLVRMGSPDYVLLVRKDIRTKIGKQPGDEVTVQLMEDNEPRVVKIPSDVQDLLDQHPAEKGFFDTLSYTHQKEYIQWITGAKRDETRERRKLKAIEMMKAGKKGV